MVITSLHQSSRCQSKSLIADAIFDIGLHKDCNFRFKQDERITDEFAIVKMTASEIVSELVRREKTWEAILKKIPDFDQKFVMEPGAADLASEIRLKPIEWKILCYLNGENSVRDISRDLKISVYKIGKYLYGLIAAGLVKTSNMSEYVAQEYFSEVGD
jgi:aminopeptidase-like protein